MVFFALKTIKAIILVTACSYFFAMGFKMLLDIQADINDWDNYSTEPPTKCEDRLDEHFICYFEMEDVGDYDSVVAFVYYSFTTLTTVGFGDFNPRSNPERIFMAIGMLSGVTVFSFFMSEFIDIVT